MTEPALDPNRFYDHDILAAPYPFMARLRAEQPVARTVSPAGREIWLVTDYKLIEEVAQRLDDFDNEFGHLFMEGNAWPEVAAILDQEPLRASLLLTTNDPAHHRFRAMVNAVFARGRIANLAPVIDALVDELIDGFVERGRCDFINEFAVLLPTYIIADILGLPRHEYDKVKQWSDAVVTVVGRTGTKEDEIRAAHDIVKFRRYLKDGVAARRIEPRDDLLSHLVTVRLDGVAPFTDDEAVALAFEIAVAGNETTRNSLSGGMVQLLRRPEQLQALIDEPSLVNNAVEEILRYETPASSIWRLARHDLTVGGVEIPAGATLLLRYDAGNRDPKVFDDPDDFDIGRRSAHLHIAFGAPSVHRCLGQMLTRKEIALALPKLLARLRNLRIGADSDTDYAPSLLFHFINKLTLTFDPGPRLDAVKAMAAE
jgi:cytochrome P450